MYINFTHHSVLKMATNLTCILDVHVEFTHLIYLYYISYRHTAHFTGRIIIILLVVVVIKTLSIFPVKPPSLPELLCLEVPQQVGTNELSPPADQTETTPSRQPRPPQCSECGPPRKKHKSCKKYTCMCVYMVYDYLRSASSHHWCVCMRACVCLCACLHTYIVCVCVLFLSPPSLPAQLQFHVLLRALLIHSHTHQHFLVSPVLCTHTYNVHTRDTYPHTMPCAK